MRVLIASTALAVSMVAGAWADGAAERTGRSDQSSAHGNTNDAGDNGAYDGSGFDDPLLGQPGHQCCRYSPDADLNGDGVLSQGEADAADAKYGTWDGSYSEDVGTSPYW